ncbi:MAG: hypothetical protein AABO41_09100 [Acidobacteriota bacterium]
MSIKEGRKRASAKSPRRKYPEGFVVPESEIRELASSLRIREAQDAALCLLVINEAAKAIGAAQTHQADNGELNLLLIKQMAREEECRRIRRIIKAIIAAIEQGAEGVLAARLTITCFIEFAFEYMPDPGVAARLYNGKLSKIRQEAQSSR